MEFFNPFLKHLWAPDSQAEAVTNINKALSALYHNGVWIKSCEAKQIAIHGLRFLQLYGQLARLAHERKIQKFPLQPKFHYVNHTWIDMLNVAKKKQVGFEPTSLRLPNARRLHRKTITHKQACIPKNGFTPCVAKVVCCHKAVFEILGG